jgi:hypothetical protein
MSIQSGIDMFHKVVWFGMRAILLIMVMCFWPLVVYVGMMVLGLSCEFVVTLVAVVVVAISVAAEATFEHTFLPGPERSVDLDSLVVAETVQTNGAAGEAGAAGEVGERPDSPDLPIGLGPLVVYNLRNRQIKQFRST